MTALDAHLDSIQPIVDSVAGDYARRFRKFGVERADLSQELWAWVIGHPDKVTGWLSEENGERPLVITLRNEAKRVCQDTKALTLGYSVHDLAWYHRNELRVLLDAMFDPEAWSNPPVSEDGGRSGGDPAQGGNWIATLADVSRGFAQLPATDKDLLRSFHEDGMTNQLLAELYGVEESTMSRRHQRAIDRLHKILGGFRPSSTHSDPCECEDRMVGARRAISNAAARALTQNQYDED